MSKFILIVLDGFGIGAMDDVVKARPQDAGSNTFAHICRELPDLKLANLESIGLMNAASFESKLMKKSPAACYGTASLAHFGADTFNGHQEIMGTRPKQPLIKPFNESIHIIYDTLKASGYKVKYMGNKLKFLLVNDYITVADNLEADPGQIYNLTAPLDYISYEEVLKVGRLVRSVVPVSRVIPFGGSEVNIDDILAAVEEKDGRFIGINAPKSGVYNKGYNVIHLGYGVNEKVQVPYILGINKIPITLLGKVADIVENPFGKSISCVDTREVLELTCREFEKMSHGFICTNVQETDLAGHAQNVNTYAEKLKISDEYIGRLKKSMAEDDLLLVMADHGNDPTIGHSHHTREQVPLLIYNKKICSRFVGNRTTLSDVGATVCDYFQLPSPENGESFLKILQS